MAVGFRQWESDPLFYAAEVVQDSADRMDSLFRMFLHEQSLFQGDPTDQKLLSSVDYHRRDLATALGTTKWQLEDFERAVNQSSFPDESNVREDVILRHKQFIRAIEEQIGQVQRSLGNSSAGTFERSSKWINLNENDRDGFASFLTGGNPENLATRHDTDNGIMGRFLNSAKVSEFNEKSDKIVEMIPEQLEVEEPRVDGTVHMNHSFDNLKKNTLRKVGSNYHTRPGFEESASSENGINESRSKELENLDSNAKSIFSKNKFRGPRRQLDVFRVLSNYWSAFGGKVGKAFVKRRSNKEVKEDFDHNTSSCYINIPQLEQGIFRTMQSCSWAEGSRRRPQWNFLLLSAIVLTLIILAILICSQLWY